MTQGNDAEVQQSISSCFLALPVACCATTQTKCSPYGSHLKTPISLRSQKNNERIRSSCEVYFYFCVLLGFFFTSSVVYFLLSGSLQFKKWPNKHTSVKDWLRLEVFCFSSNFLDMDSTSHINASL